MNKILSVLFVMGCVLMNSAFGAITFIDAELGNTTIGDAAPAEGVNYSTDYSALDDLWGWRTNRTDTNGDGIWVTDGGAGAGEYDREDTVALKVDVTLPEAGITYDLYAIIMNNGSGAGRWDVSARVGDTGEFVNFNRDSVEMTQALAEDFDGDVTVSGGGDMTMKVRVGRYTTTSAGETVSIYINGFDTWEIAGLDQRTRFDGVGYAIAPVFAVSPYDGEIDVAADNVSLTWGGGQDPNAVGSYVYLGTAEDALDCLNAGSKVPVDTYTYFIGNIDMNTTYYWQIETAMDGVSGGYPAGDPNNVVSEVFSFTTIFSIPIIVEDPSSQVVSEGETAEFSVTVESLTTPTYKWYFTPDATNDTPGDDTLLSENEVLTVTDVTIADEGYYYCAVNNQSGTEVASGVAGLGVKRLVAHWSLDSADYVGGKYQDLSGEGHHADPNGTPVFVAGQLAEGINILRADGSAAPTTDSWASAGTWNPSEFSGMLSVTFWMKWDGQNSADSEQVIISKRSSDNLGDATLWQITRPGSNGNSSVWFQSPNGNVTVNSVLTKDEWQQIVVTFDGTTGVIYNNGTQVASSNFALGDNDAAINAMINLGGSNFDNNPSRWMNGALDDVKIYNYALADLDIAKTFVAEKPGSSVCVQSLKPDAAFDYNDDCKVDLADFAVLAAEWLDCGLVPDCIN